MGLDGERLRLEPHMGVLIPPRVKPSIHYVGLEDLVFVVMAWPAGDMPH